MKTRTDLLNHLAEKYNLQRYLEIGVQDPAQNFDKISCYYRLSVDPDPNAKAKVQNTSDEFFAWYQEKNIDNKFDLIFIDGLHTAEQVKKDFENALKILSSNGFIVLHDCNPEKEEHTIVPRPTDRGHWNGDVYRTAVCLSGLFQSDQFYTVDIDNGCGVLQYKGESLRFNDIMEPNWDYFNTNRKELLNLITWDEFVSIGS
jgi:hypothetical protein